MNSDHNAQNEESKVSSAELKLQSLIKANSHEPAQGTSEWLEKRKLTIGGSEIANIIGCGYESCESFLYRKILNGKTKTCDQNVNMLFGKMFETLHRNYLAKVFKTQIRESGSFGHPSLNGQRYSPDGLAIIQFDVLNEVCSVNPLNKSKLAQLKKHGAEDLLVLFEQKAPFARLVTTKAKVPRVYKPQVLTGLDTIRECELCVYTEAQFIVGKECHFKDKVFCSHIAINAEKWIDSGAIYVTSDDKNLHANFEEMKRDDALLFILNNRCAWSYHAPEDKHVVGILAWKLSNISYTILLPEYGYIDKYKNQLQSCLKLLNECDVIEDKKRIRELVHDSIEQCQVLRKRICKRSRKKYDDDEMISTELAMIESKSSEPKP